MKRSYLTGEFQLAVAFMCLGFAALVFAILQSADLVGVAAVLGSISTAVSTFIFGRSRVKEKQGDSA
jgi:predicted RND superfamily exporter protein